MAQAANQELVDLFEEFYRRYYSDDVAELAREYPRESKSLHLDWRDLYQMDPNLADDDLNHPDDLQKVAEEALRLCDLPVDGGTRSAMESARSGRMSVSQRGRCDG